MLKPREGVSLVMLVPIVDMTLYPHMASPTDIPTPPASKIHHGTASCFKRYPVLK